jgi:DNA-directed RNA polymerase subunit beta'
MAYLDQQEAYDDFKKSVLEGVKSYFPIAGTMQTVELHHLDVKDPDPESDDLRGQHEAKINGDTWASPVHAMLSLKDTKTGKVLQTKSIRVAEIPRITKRYSYIVDGQEYQVDNQWQLKHGVYVRRRTNGELESSFNTPGREFKVILDPATKQLNMNWGKASKIAVYPLMKALGVDDDTLEQHWGKEVFAANKQARGLAGALNKFYRADRKADAPSHEEAVKYFQERMADSEVDPSVTQKTLGKAFKSVDGDTLLRATSKMLKVQAGAPEDDRDSLEFKRLRTAGDYAKDMLTDWRVERGIRTRMSRQVNRATDLRQVVKFGMLNDPIKKTFKSNSAARQASQINPLEMAASAQQTTIMGPGGIQSQQAIDNTISLKLVNPSHLGFLDPVKTPENEKTGVILRLPTGVRKLDGEARTPLYNLKTNRVEYLSPVQFAKASVVLPDQVTWKDNKPVPKSQLVQMSMSGNKLGEGRFKEADYVMRHPSQLFSLTTNLIPFLGNTSGNRATYAGSHLEQAISLKHRETPLVQVGTGIADPAINTFEGIMGRQAGHVALHSGKVTAVKKDGITIQHADGKTHEVQLYDNFPLNDPKGVFHSTATAKVGDSVKAGESVADTNFTRNGKLALGTNLRVAYLPLKGYNFEDGVVISRSASQKMTSEHLYKESQKIPEDAVRDIKRFKIQHPAAFKEDQYKKLDDTGVIKVGQRVMPGDPIAIAMTPYKIKDRLGIAAARKSFMGVHSDASMRWKSDYPGEVVAVHQRPDGTVAVHVRTEEPMQVGDKITGRHGNKGIVVQVLEDNQMPHTKDGKHIEVALNPSGVPGRMNVGQVLETAAGKIALKTGKPYIVNNFDGTDAVSRVKAELKSHGLSDQEELFDAETGKSLGPALVGPQHMLKLVHQIDKKISIRSGMAPLPGDTPEKYDNNLIPSGSGKTGGQSIGHNGLYTLLAHGAKANIREMQTWKSEGEDKETNLGKQWRSQHGQVWRAIQMGEPLPTPAPTFSFQKFTDLLRAAGVNVEKQGHQMKLLPFTDKQVLALSNGEIKKPETLTMSKLDDKGELRPMRDGLFDPKVTGGHGGRGWGHIVLPEPVPNPVFEGAIRKLLDMKAKDYDSIVSGDKALGKSGKLVELGTQGSLAGGAAIKKLLDDIDPVKDLAAAEKQLDSMTLKENIAHGGSTQKVDALVKKVKYLRTLKELGIKPSEAYIMHNLPVIPPVMRPVAIINGNAKWDDLSGLYHNLGQVVAKLKDPEIAKNLTDTGKKALRRDLYDGVKALTGMDKLTDDNQRQGILHQISGFGDSPKFGFFQETLLKRKQDLTMRSTIIPEPALGLDEIGLPRDRALQLYKPFVVKKLVDIGAASSPLPAQQLIKDKSRHAYRALELVTQERPVIVKRDPALHKHSVQAFRPKLVHGDAIQIHPLTTSGYNADFDGDTMSVYVPISPEAVKEAQDMFPSNNLYNESTGKVIYKPTLEGALGLYKLSRVVGDSKMKFATAAEALKAVQQGKLTVNHSATVAGQKVTPGRLLLASVLPEAMKKHFLTDDPDKGVINGEGLDQLFETLAKNHKGEFGTVANRLKDMGNGAAYGSIAVHHPDHKGPVAIAMAEGHGVKREYIPVPVHSLSLDDFTVDHAVRDKYTSAAKKEVAHIARSSGTTADKDRKTVAVWEKAMAGMTKEHLDKMEKNPTNLAIMVQANVKPSKSQYRQMVLAPGILEDASGRPIPTPVIKSYSEGLDLAGYWTQAHGSRGGTIKKVQEVRDPGYFSKQLMQATMSSAVITGEDCGTHRGITMNVGNKEVHDRVLASDFSAKGTTIPRDTVLSPEVVGKIRSLDKDANLLVRSTLKCEHEKGICQKCAGLSPNGGFYKVGTNLGVISAQALGERSVQLTLKAFHSGGVRTGGSGTMNSFKRVQDLTLLPGTIADSATLAMKSGTIDNIEHDATGVKVWIGGLMHHIGKDRSGAVLSKPLTGESVPGWFHPKVGMKVEAGQVLSDPTRSFVNPHDLYKATNSMERVQNFLTDELHHIYKNEGVRRQNIETVVRSMGELTKIRDPGDSDDVMKGEYRNASHVRTLNKELAKKGKSPIEHSPILKGIDVLPLEVQEDWAAKLMHQKLRGTIVEAVAMGASSNIHGLHPVPAMAFGAEIGLTSKDSKKPGLAHLKNVADYNY